MLFCRHYFSLLNTFMRKGKDPEPDPDPYLWLMDPYPGGPKTCGSSGSGFPTLLGAKYEVCGCAVQSARRLSLKYRISDPKNPKNIFCFPVSKPSSHTDLECVNKSGTNAHVWAPLKLSRGTSSLVAFNSPSEQLGNNRVDRKHYALPQFVCIYYFLRRCDEPSLPRAAWIHVHFRQERAATLLLECSDIRMICYSATRMLCYSATRMICYSASRMLCYSATRMICYSATRMLCYSNDLPLCYSNALLPVCCFIF